MVLVASDRAEDGLLGDKGAGIPATSLGICNICEIGLICKFEGGINKGLGDLACCSGGVGKDLGGRELGVFLTNRGEGGPSVGEKGGVGLEPSIDI